MSLKSIVLSSGLVSVCRIRLLCPVYQLLMTFADRKSKETTFYIDIKSELLRDILREVLRNVRAVNLMEDKPSVLFLRLHIGGQRLIQAQIEQNIVFHFLPELEEYVKKLEGKKDYQAKRLKHLVLLVGRIKENYAPMARRLTPLLRRRQITFDLLPALFKPGSLVYGTCLGTKKPRCIVFDAGEEVKYESVTYYKLECRYLDFDGKVFGEAGTLLGVEKFRGSKPIHALEAFPLYHHPDQEKIRKELIECGRKFLGLAGAHLRHCHGSAFIMHNGDAVKLNINSHVAVDAAFFHEMQPNYSRPRIHKSYRTDSNGTIFVDLTDYQRQDEMDKVKSNDREAHDMKDDDLLICCPTVRCFSFNEKCFCRSMSTLIKR